jgi:N-acyl-D-aspartate/D-glutamate deacylase
VVTKSSGSLDDEEYRLIDMLLSESGRPVTWGALLKRFDYPESCYEAMRKADPLIKRGAIPQVASFRVETELSLRVPFDFGTFPSWGPAFNQPPEVQKRLYCDASFRRKFREELKAPPPGSNFLGDWNLVLIKSTGKPELKPLEGKSVADVARERGNDGLDTFLDLAVEDNLDLLYKYPMFDVANDLITDPRTMISLSDGGAHVTMICDAGYCTELIGSAVRDQRLMSLELGVKRLTSEPADFFGIKQRGRLEVGSAADIVIFDYNTIGSSTLKTVPLHDLPGGATRLVTHARGIEYTIVNGRVVYEHGKPSGGLPGQVLRSGAC